MLDAILKKLNLCRAEELDAANKTISAQRDMLGQSNERIKDLKDQLEFAHKQSSGLGSKVEEYLSDIRARDDQIATLRQELTDEKYRHDKLQDFELSEARLLEETKASLKVYKDAEAAGYMIIIPCKPGNTVYWVSGGFDAGVKPYAVEFNEILGYAIIEMTARAIITNDKGTMVLMDASKCIENLPSFHIEDFGKCLFTNIDDANSVFAEIIENSTPVKGERKKSSKRAKVEYTTEAAAPDEEPIEVEAANAHSIEDTIDCADKEVIDEPQFEVDNMPEDGRDDGEPIPTFDEDPVSTKLPHE